MNKMSLKKDAGPIVFVGGMNAMPMMYAVEFKKLGYDVLYLVDRPISDTLSRPENHFSEISYPYPDWIVEFPVASQMALPFMRAYFSRKIERLVAQRNSKSAQAYIFNGLFISLAPFFSNDVKKISLTHGSDLDSWADVDGVSGLAESFKTKSFFKYMPSFLAKRLIAVAVNRQFFGLSSSRTVIYFPRGFNTFGDRVLNRLQAKGVEVLERYDVSFDPLKNESRTFKESGDKLVIFSGVRFTFLTFSEGNADYSKGNDHIINGIGRLYKEYKNIEVHFVEKGPDVAEAKRLCRENGLETVVVWHEEMKFTDLLGLYRKADVCFDQVGRHWIGAIGAYALWLGKPLVANDFLPVQCGAWPDLNPICSAATEEEVFVQLSMLRDKNLRRDISEKSKIFAEDFFSSKKVVSALLR